MSENTNMTCAELADVAAELALGVLTGRERAMAVAHLDTCEACREDVRQLMATGEQLLELLPPAEPPPGFETRVLARLGFPVLPQAPMPPAPVRFQEPARPRKVARRGGPRRRGPARGGMSPGGRPSGAVPGGDRPGGTPRPGRARRALAAASVGLAVIAAGLAGWRIGVATSPSAGIPSGDELAAADLISTADQHVGSVILYSGTPEWVGMTVDLASGHELVKCELVGANGQPNTIGTFQLHNGEGYWTMGLEGNATDATGARLVSDNGKLLATATFPSA